MPDKEFTIDENTKALTFAEDRLPVVVKYNGNTIEGMSALTKNVNNSESDVNEVSYTSEYNKSLMGLGVSGATSQALPTEYQQVEYIESTGSDTYSGTQYIDTGYKPNQNTKVEVKCQYRYPAQSVFGANPYFVLTTGSSKYRFRYNSTAIDTTVSALDLVILTLDRNVAYLNGELIGTFTEATFQSAHNALLFARNNASGVVEERAKARVYYAKIWDDGALVRNFIPCYRKSDNVIGMYDLVNNVFYTNKGTGTFVKGANASPTPDLPIPIQNANDNGMSVILRGENLFNAQGEIAFGAGSSRFEFGNNYVTNRTVTPSAADYVVFSKTYPAGTYTISAKGEYAGDGFTFRFLCTAKSNGGTYNSYYKSYYFDLLKATLPQNAFTFTTTEDFQIGFTFAGTPTYLRGIIYDIMLTPTSQAVEYKPYVEETVEIPTSITLNGENVPLLFSEYDKLTVDRVKNEVIYNTYSYYHVFTGEEDLQERNVLNSGITYRLDIPSIHPDYKHCSHFKKSSSALDVLRVSTNVFFTTTASIGFKTDGVQSVEEFKSFLSEQYLKNSPVTVLVRLLSRKPYNITNTDLGISILDLTNKIPYGTIYLEISSGLTVPITVNYAKWGGANE